VLFTGEAERPAGGDVLRDLLLDEGPRRAAEERVVERVVDEAELAAIGRA
jgi:hypothetical protein